MIEIPSGVVVGFENRKMKVNGPKGEVEKHFSLHASISVTGNTVDIQSKDRAYLNTVNSLVASMIKGVTQGYERKLKIVYAHFPVSVEVKGMDVLIKNFQGEKMPRKTKLVGATKISVQSNIVTVSGPDNEAVGQTTANLKAATKIKNKDARVFQDGLYEVS